MNSFTFTKKDILELDKHQQADFFKNNGVPMVELEFDVENYNFRTYEEKDNYKIEWRRKMDSYYIEGNTYPIKDDLKAHGCRYDYENKRWITPLLDKESFKYKLLQSLCESSDSDIIPKNLSGEAKKIQEILGRGRV